MENITTSEKNKMAALYGLILGIIYLAIYTACNIFVGKFLVFYVAKFVGYVLFFIIMGVLATRIKKANGGFIEFREIFGAIFIMILISELIYMVYNFIYYKYIDPDFMIKVKNAYNTFMEGFKIPDDKLEDANKSMDKAMAEVKTFNLLNNIKSYLSIIIMDSLFGLLVCLAVRKSRPVFE